MAKQKVLISGAGPAGLATGILLNRETFDVTLVEKNSDFSSIGFAIILWRSGYEVLNKILGDTQRNLYPLDKFSIYGREKIDLLQTIKMEKGDIFSIKRADLISQLSAKYIAVCGLDSVKFNTEISRIVQNSDGSSTVKFNDGSSDIYDIVVLADGMHSQIRNTLFSVKQTLDAYKINYVWIKSSTSIQNEALLGFMKGYVYLLQSAGEETLLAYYNYGDIDENEKFLQKILSSFCAEGREIVIDKENERIFNSEKIRVKQAHRGNTVLIGDSYHGHPPTLAMGTSLALEDAYALSELLNSTDEKCNNQNISSELEKFTNIRSKRIRDVYQTQDAVETFFISGNKIVIWLDSIALEFGAWPFIERRLRKLFTKSVIKAT